jgi:hypothetical protein
VYFLLCDSFKPFQVTHYEEFFDVDALLRTTEVALEEEREAHAAAVAAGSAAPWHSAVGMMIEGAGAAEGGANAASAALPPLPRMWAWRDSVGKKVVEQAQKHNSYMATMAGAYPEGKARRRGRQPTPSSTVGQAMIHGIGTFVILMTERETQELEQMVRFFLQFFSSSFSFSVSLRLLLAQPKK